MHLLLNHKITVTKHGTDPKSPQQLELLCEASITPFLFFDILFKASFPTLGFDNHEVGGTIDIIRSNKHRNKHRNKHSTNDAHDKECASGGHIDVLCVVMAHRHTSASVCNFATKACCFLVTPTTKQHNDNGWLHILCLSTRVRVCAGEHCFDFVPHSLHLELRTASFKTHNITTSQHDNINTNGECDDENSRMTR